MAATKKTPLQRVRDEFGDKEKLVDRLMGIISNAEADKDTLKAKLLAASNQKLLRLMGVASEVKQKFGSPEKLAEALAQAVGKAKDQAYVAKVARLAQRTPARVLDMLRVAQRKTKGKAA